jgi:hypothetical protein
MGAEYFTISFPSALMSSYILLAERSVGILNLYELPLVLYRLHEFELDKDIIRKRKFYEPKSLFF